MQEPKISLAIHPKFLKKFGFNRLLRWVDKFGINYVELPLRGVDDFLNIQTALGQNFQVSLHLQDDWYKNADRYLFSERLHDLAYILALGSRNGNSPIIFNIHPADDHNATPEANFQITCEVLSIIQGMIERGKLNFQLCVENLRFKKENSGHFGYDLFQLVDLAKKCPGIKFAFDIGHYIQNTFQGQSSEIPSGFSQRVTHIHVHDFHPEWGDHLPLGKGIVPLKRLIQPLIEQGYQGIFCLELHNIQKFPKQEIPSMIRNSIITLKDIICSSS